tara:strand:- start:281 stop:490 length:210 start_codon:yes stop_codon:yes gene_type:complete
MLEDTLREKEIEFDTYIQSEQEKEWQKFESATISTSYLKVQLQDDLKLYMLFQKERKMLDNFLELGCIV